MTSSLLRLDWRLPLFAALILCQIGQLCARTPNATQSDAERAILEALETLRSPDVDSRQRSLAYAGYRQAVAALLPELERQAVVPDENVPGKYFNPEFFSRITPVSRPVVTVNGLHREGLGLPLVGAVQPNHTADPNTPRTVIASR
jgi:hypothetical protein